MINPANLKKSILDYAVRGELSAKFRLSCHCEERTGGAISSLSSLRESEANEAIQKNSKISKFKDNGNSLDCFDFSAKNLAMTNKTAFDEIAEFNAKISTLKSQREKLLSNLEMSLRGAVKQRRSNPANGEAVLKNKDNGNSLDCFVSSDTRNDSKEKTEQLKRIISKLKTKINSYKTITPLNTDGDFNPPFEIPNSWAWVKLGEIINLISGRDLETKFILPTKTQYPYLTGASNFNNGTIIVDRYIDKPQVTAQKGDLLITCKGTVGELCILQLPQVHIARQIMAIRTSLLINTKFLLFLIATKIEHLKNISKSMIPGISREDILTLPIPLPPKNEQKFIASELEKLLSLCKNL